MKTKPIKCASGITGWQGRLRDQYASMEEFTGYAEIYGLAGRLGFDNVTDAWDANPLVQGSVNPSDFRRVPEPRRLSIGLRYGTDANGKRICLGAQMGRRNTLPADLRVPLKLHLVRLRLVDGDYDQGGAYWGHTAGTSIYWAFAEGVEIFVRATGRHNAQEQVLEKIPAAQFFR